jgi:hypothetical protein
MNTTKLVADFRKAPNVSAVMNSHYIIDLNGKESCTSPDSFEFDISRWDSLTDDEKQACHNFVKDMDLKYGKTHGYSIPKTLKHICKFSNGCSCDTCGRLL